MRNRWTMLAVHFLARTSMAFQFQSVGSLSPFLVDGLGIDYGALGTLIGLYMLPGILIALPGGLMGRQFGETRMCLLSQALMTVGSLLMGMSETYAVASAGRIIAGMGGVILNVLLSKMVADWFAGREIMIAMALFVNSWPVGVALGLMTLGPLAELSGWPMALHLTAMACALSLALVAIFYRPRPGAVEPPRASSWRCPPAPCGGRFWRRPWGSISPAITWAWACCRQLPAGSVIRLAIQAPRCCSPPPCSSRHSSPSRASAGLNGGGLRPPQAP